MTNSRWFLAGLDVGGTKIAAGLVSFPEGRVHVRQMAPSRPERGGGAVLEDVARMTQSLAQAAREQDVRLAGVGIGICELVDRDGRILSSNCIHWEESHVVERLSEFGLVTIDADVRVAALAEAHFGAGKSMDTFLYVTIGTGMSSCLVIGGEPFLGAHGATGTFASSSLRIPCERCGQIHPWALEHFASGPGLVGHYRKNSPKPLDSAEEVLALANSGDPVASRLVRLAGEAAGSSIALLVNVMDPESVIIGGGLGLSKGAYWDALVDALHGDVWSDVHRGIPVVRAATGTDSGIVGAAAAAWRRGIRDSRAGFEEGGLQGTRA